MYKAMMRIELLATKHEYSALGWLTLEKMPYI